MTPFSAAWWSAPHYYPSSGVAAFTESLVGISPLVSPIAWLTGNPVAAYGVAYFLSWPLSAMAVFLLVERLTRRPDAAFVAGMAFAFTPYRTTEIAHIQSLSLYYLPVALLACHAHLDERRSRWLWLFAAAWLLQSFANLYYMCFGAVLIAMWIGYFGSRRLTIKPAFALLVVWAAAGLPLAAVLFRYAAIHASYGFTRGAGEILAFSATPQAWFEATGDVALWRHLLPAGKDNLFPGVVAPLLTVIGSAVLVVHPGTRSPSGRLARTARALLLLTVAASAAAVIATLAVGPWSVAVGGLLLRMGDLDRALVAGSLATALLILLTPALRQAVGRRSPLVFYTASTLAIAAFCLGPAIRVGNDTVLSPAPYAWLMALPGFSGLRAVPRFWMLGVLCLSVAAGLALSHVQLARRARLSLAAALCLLAPADGWMPAMRLVDPPELWADVEPPGRPEAILELPLGPDWDWAATFRAAHHQRRVVNGVSGYDPPHYVALRTALEDRDPQALRGLATLGPLDVIVDRAADPDGTIDAFVRNTPGAVAEATASATRTLYRFARQPPPPLLGEPVAIAEVRAYRHAELLAGNDKRAPELSDGKLTTAWTDYPQTPGQWIEIDLASEGEIGGLSCALGTGYLAFPRQLAIEVSLDRQAWRRVWEGGGAAPAFAALIERPREGTMRLAFLPAMARYVRLLQTGTAEREWRVAEVQLHGPASGTAGQVR